MIKFTTILNEIKYISYKIPVMQVLEDSEGIRLGISVNINNKIKFLMDTDEKCFELNNNYDIDGENKELINIKNFLDHNNIPYKFETYIDVNSTYSLTIPENYFDFSKAKKTKVF